MQHEDARMCSRRMKADVSETSIEGDQDPVFGSSRLCQLTVVSTDEILVCHGGDIVVMLSEELDDASRDVLVGFELHGCGSGSTSSPASAAP